jgi:hypothetical protein
MSQDFKQSEADLSFFIFHDRHGGWICLTYYIDDLAYIANSPKMEEEFETKLARRFNINFIGDASWFLQIGIH